MYVKADDRFKRFVVKIQPIQNFYTSFIRSKDNNISVNRKNVLQLAPLQSDVVSFGSKKYDSGTILNPTNHCGYCGCKLYNETQIESIAKEIMLSKGARLEGKVKSVLEKLAEAKHSQELEVAKRLENKDEIDFFNTFLDVAAKKSFLKGAELFQQVYHMDEDTAMNTVVKNMHPLLKTIDHISPQREDKENMDSDVNLVEACYCCNHDLKKGSSFNEFYMMFPTIKNNMTKEKFQYALSQILDSSQNQVLQRLSASNMLKFLERLFVQRTETQNALDSVDYRIQGCKSGIQDSIQTCRDEISLKEKEKQSLEQKFYELKQNPEYSAMLKRVGLQSKLDGVTTALNASRNRKQRLTDSMNALKAPPKKNRKQKNAEQMSEEDKKKKKEQTKADIELLTAQIEEQEHEKFNLELGIEEINEQYPTIETVQAQKSKVDSVVNAHLSIEKVSKILEDSNKRLQEEQKKETDLKSKIADMPEKVASFSVELYSDEEQETFKRYKDLVETLSFIKEHPNGGSVRIIINTKAREPIAQEIEQLQQLDIIKTYMDSEKLKGYNSELEKVQKNIYDINTAIHQAEKTIRNNKRIAEGTSLESAQAKSNELAEVIKRLNEQQNNLKIPQLITKITAEIELLNQTVEDLINQQKKIETTYA